MVSNDLPSLCVLVDPDVACVQPKVRTAAVGCTLRSYTQNLALLPPRGIVTTGWHVPPGRLSPENETAALNILIVPYPFKLRATWFAPTRAKGPRRDDGADGAIERGWFEIDQRWLSPAVVDFTVELIKEAKQDTGAIHGVLFPEYALDWSTFDALKNRVLEEFPKLEFLVAGSSSNCGNQKGNFALSAVFLDIDLKDEDASGSPLTTRACFVGSRSKHHPWRIDEPQVSNYALGSTLDPRAVWWEATPWPGSWPTAPCRARRSPPSPAARRRRPVARGGPGSQHRVSFCASPPPTTSRAGSRRRASTSHVRSPELTAHRPG